LLAKYSPETIKFALLETNYRGDINITDKLFPEAESHLNDFYKVYALAIEKGIKIDGEFKQIDDEFNACMDDDFNTALALSNLYGYFKKAKSLIAQGDALAGAMLAQIKKTYSLLGLFKKEIKAGEKPTEDIPAEIIAIAEERKLARQNKNWAESDRLRDEIFSLGYEIKDSKDGYTIIKK
jgi:cysteinyl-tRNA synthetase